LHTDLGVLTKERPSFDFTDEIMSVVLRNVMEDIISVWQEEMVAGETHRVTNQL